MTPSTPVSLPADARTILLSIPDAELSSTEACLRMVADRAPVNPLVFYVTFTRSPGALYDQWHQVVDSDPAEFVILDARDQSEAEIPDRADDEDVTVVSERPDDLTWFGIHATEYLTRWHEQDNPIIVCFDSLSVLLQYATSETVYRFLHVLTGRVENAGGTGFYHIDPLANEDAVVNTMAQLCDCRVTYDSDGEWSIRSR